MGCGWCREDEFTPDSLRSAKKLYRSPKAALSSSTHMSKFTVNSTPDFAMVSAGTERPCRYRVLWLHIESVCLGSIPERLGLVCRRRGTIAALKQ